MGKETGIEMNDQELIEECYKTMYQGMIDKDRDTLNSVLDSSFVLVHMTEMEKPATVSNVVNANRLVLSIFQSDNI